MLIIGNSIAYLSVWFPIFSVDVTTPLTLKGISEPGRWGKNYSDLKI
jgi:hypothetical protein